MHLLQNNVLCGSGNTIIKCKKHFRLSLDSILNFRVNLTFGTQERTNVALQKAATIILIDISQHIPTNHAEIGFIITIRFGCSKTA
ncbi:hypothetical protein D3C85_1788750 [compost metagenome]